MKKGLENAEAMRQLANINYQEKEDCALKKAQELLDGEVAHKIRQAASSGKYSTYYTCHDETVRRHLKKLLQDNGYKTAIPLLHDHILIAWN